LPSLTFSQYLTYSATRYVAQLSYLLHLIFINIPSYFIIQD
jgi:hypothetical protein